MTIGVDHPLWLAVTAVALAGVVTAHRSSRAGVPVVRARVSLALRLVAVAVVGAALAGVTLRRAADRQCVLFVLDGSDSVPAGVREDALRRARQSLRERAPGDRAGLVVFGAHPLIEESPSAEPSLGSVTSRLETDGSDLAAALRLAAGLFPDGCTRRVVLLTDGNETSGRALDEAGALAAAGIRVDAWPLGAEGKRDALVDRVLLPARIGEGETAEVTVLVSATHDGAGTLKIWRDESYLGAARVTYSAGRRTAHTFRDRVPTRGVHRYRAQLEPDGADAHAANDVGEGLALVEGRPGLLYVHGDEQPSHAFTRALTAQGFAVDVRTAAGVPVRLTDLASYSVILLDDVAAPSLSTNQHRLLASFVRDLGGGLAMLGGPHSFGAGGWYRTAVEDVLPVTMDLSRKKLRPKVSMVVAIDQSGSMAQEEGGVAKIRLAAEGAVNVAQLLATGDRFGMQATDTEVHWIVPIAELPADRTATVAAARGLETGGGGIYVYTSLRAAYEALERETSQVRHLLLFSDTSDTEQPVGERGEHVLDMARAALAKRITLSVVGIGQERDKDTGLLRGLAQAGGGRFYLTASAASVPQIFSQDAMLASRAVIVEKPITPQRTGASDVLRGLDALPPLQGYVATAVRPLAQTPLMASEEDPLLAHWSAGLGRSLAFTSDVRGRWSRDWLAWPGYAKLFAQGVQWLAGARGKGEYPARVTLEGGQGRVSIEALGEDGDFVNFLSFRAQVVPPSQPGFSVPLEQVAPGRYAARFPARGEGSWLVNVQRLGPGGEPATAQLVGAAQPFSAEFRTVGPDVELLRQLTRATGGRLLGPELEGIHRHDRPGPSEPIDPWRDAVRLALLLVLADVAVRRLAGWRRPAQPAGAPVGSVAASLADSAAARLVERLRTVRDARDATRRGGGPGTDGGESPLAQRLDASRNVESKADPAPDGPAAEPPRPGGAVAAPDDAPSHTARLLEAKRRARQKRERGGSDA